MQQQNRGSTKLKSRLQLKQREEQELGAKQKIDSQETEYQTQQKQTNPEPKLDDSLQNSDTDSKENAEYANKQPTDSGSI